MRAEARQTWHQSYIDQRAKTERRWNADFYREHRKRHNGAYLPEEVAPCGRAGEIGFHYYFRRDHEKRDPQIDDVLVSEARPWRLVLWEPIPTKAPGPHLSSPFCCYLRTVIFYHRPYTTSFAKITPRPGKKWWRSTGTFFEWDQIETRLGWSALITYRGDVWEPQGGRVVWARHPITRQRGWWMRWSARRKER